MNTKHTLPLEPLVREIHFFLCWGLSCSQRLGRDPVACPNTCPGGWHLIPEQIQVGDVAPLLATPEVMQAGQGDALCPQLCGKPLPVSEVCGIASQKKRAEKLPGAEESSWKVAKRIDNWTETVTGSHCTHQGWSPVRGLVDSAI